CLLMLKHLHDFGRQLAQGLLSLVYPSICAACGQSVPVERRHSFCDSCRIILTTDPYTACPRCASTIGAFTASEEGCVRCRDETLHFERALRLGPYQGLLRELILRMKHASGESVAEWLGTLWAEHAEARLRAVGAELIIPVPLHWRRRWSRG